METEEEARQRGIQEARAEERRMLGMIGRAEDGIYTFDRGKKVRFGGPSKFGEEVGEVYEDDDDEDDDGDYDSDGEDNAPGGNRLPLGASMLATGTQAAGPGAGRAPPPGRSRNTGRRTMFPLPPTAPPLVPLSQNLRHQVPPSHQPPPPSGPKDPMIISSRSGKHSNHRSDIKPLSTSLSLPTSGLVQPPTPNRQGQHEIRLSGGRVHITGPPVRQTSGPPLIHRHRDGYFVNDEGKRVNTAGRLINEIGQLLDDQGRLVNQQGKLVIERGELVHEHGDILHKVFEERENDDRLDQNIEAWKGILRDWESGGEGITVEGGIGDKGDEGGNSTDDGRGQQDEREEGEKKKGQEGFTLTGTGTDASTEQSSLKDVQALLEKSLMEQAKLKRQIENERLEYERERDQDRLQTASTLAQERAAHATALAKEKAQSLALLIQKQTELERQRAEASKAHLAEAPRPPRTSNFTASGTSRQKFGTDTGSSGAKDIGLGQQRQSSVSSTAAVKGARVPFGAIPPDSISGTFDAGKDAIRFGPAAGIASVGATPAAPAQTGLFNPGKDRIGFGPLIGYTPSTGTGANNLSSQEPEKESFSMDQSSIVSSPIIGFNPPTRPPAYAPANQTNQLMFTHGGTLPTFTSSNSPFTFATPPHPAGTTGFGTSFVSTGSPLEISPVVHLPIQQTQHDTDQAIQEGERRHSKYLQWLEQNRTDQERKDNDMGFLGDADDPLDFLNDLPDSGIVAKTPATTNTEIPISAPTGPRADLYRWSRRGIRRASKKWPRRGPSSQSSMVSRIDPFIAPVGGHSHMMSTPVSQPLPIQPAPSPRPKRVFGVSYSPISPYRGKKTNDTNSLGSRLPPKGPRMSRHKRSLEFGSTSTVSTSPTQGSSPVLPHLRHGLPAASSGLSLAPDHVRPSNSIPVHYPSEVVPSPEDNTPAVPGVLYRCRNKEDHSCHLTFATMRLLREHEDTHSWTMWGGAGPIGDSTIDPDTMLPYPVSEEESTRLIRDREVRHRLDAESQREELKRLDSSDIREMRARARLEEEREQRLYGHRVGEEELQRMLDEGDFGNGNGETKQKRRVMDEARTDRLGEEEFQRMLDAGEFGDENDGKLKHQGDSLWG